jgi:acetyltransferase-like isoleucine patch superfamily enzyme
MRKITAGPIAAFSSLAAIALAIALAASIALWRALPAGEFRAIVTVVLGLVFAYVALIGVYRLFILRAPLSEGVVAKGSSEEFVYHVYLLFYLAFFQPLTRSLLLPVPLMRLVYLALGARLGEETYSAGVILDPPLTDVGSHSIIGHDAVLFCHAVERDELSLARIRIGSGVTIGAKAVIMPGVTIGDGAVVAVSAVVAKGTRIGAGEVWGGIPARLLKPAPAAATPGYRTAQGS